MSKNLKLIILIAALVALLAGAAVLYDFLRGEVDAEQLATQGTQSSETNPSGNATEETRIPAPDIVVLNWDGKECKLSDFVGKPVILNFWASWCSPCKSEMPAFEEAYLEYGDEIHFLMVNCTTSSRETRARAIVFIQEQGYTFPVYFDTTGEAASTYGAYSIPLTFFIDAEGYPVAYAQGAIDADVLQQGIDMILP